TCWPRIACSRPPIGVIAASSLMSAPATNDLSPAPVSTSARTASSCFRSRTARRSSSSVAVSSAFRTFGRLMVTTATAPSRSTSRCSKLISDRPSERERIHQPSEHHRGGEKGAEHHRGGPDLLTPLVLQQRGEHDRHEQRVDDHEEKMARRNGRQHHFLPCAMSKASRIARKFSRPDVIRNVLPYSYDAAVTVPAPASARCAMTYGSPMPRSAIAPRNTSGSDHSSGKIRPCSHRPNAHMSGSVTRNTTPLSRRPR